jgi:hypothetical protein
MLLLGLRSHRSHPGLLHRGPDGARIRRVGLIGLHEGSDELRVQKDDLVPQCLDLARPPVRAATCFQDDPPWRPATQELDQIVAAEPAVHNLTSVAVDPIHLEYSLRYIQAVRGGMHFGTSALQWVAVED